MNRNEIRMERQIIMINIVFFRPHMACVANNTVSKKRASRKKENELLLNIPNIINLSNTIEERACGARR